MNKIEKYEEYIREKLEIPFVKLENLEEMYAVVIIKTLEDAFRKYPLLKNSLCAVGSKEYINAHINLNICASLKKQESGLIWKDYTRKKQFFSILECYFRETKKKIPHFIGLSIDDLCYKLSFSECEKQIAYLSQAGHFVPHCKSIENLVWHEVGHLMVICLSICESEAFRNYCKTIFYDIETEISKYATVSIQEFVAECFQEYHSTSSPNPHVKEVVEIILEEYNNFARKKNQKEVLNLTRYYKF